MDGETETDARTPRPRRAPSRAEIIPAETELRRRAVNSSRGMLLQPTREDLKRLEQAVEASTDKVITTIGAKLKALREASLRGPANQQAAISYLREIEAAAFEIKGLGGTFSFPLLTAIAKSLNAFVRGRDSVTAVQLKIISFHIDALYVVLFSRIRGQGGDTESALLHAFETAVARFK